MPSSIALNCDCMEYMKSLPDKAFDLAVVDPPYGDALSNESGGGGTASDSDSTGTRRLRFHGGSKNPNDPWNKYLRPPTQQLPQERERDGSPDGRDMGKEVRKKIIAWDVAPGQEYFDELFRISRNQIIWGGNYFNLPPTRCFLIWRKLTISEKFSMAMCEYAWTSFNSNAKLFEYAPQGKVGDQRFHPTQKPIALYEWVYKLYAEPGMKILDTHLGSGSSRIAAYDAGLDFVGCEIDKTYFDLQEERFERHTAQENLFLDNL